MKRILKLTILILLITYISFYFFYESKNKHPIEHKYDYGRITIPSFRQYYGYHIVEYQYKIEFLDYDDNLPVVVLGSSAVIEYGIMPDPEEFK
jgi:hypothetical protein